MLSELHVPLEPLQELCVYFFPTYTCLNVTFVKKAKLSMTSITNQFTLLSLAIFDSVN